MADVSRCVRPLAINLFAGVGGMSLGFEQAGFDVLAAFDVEQRHVEQYAQNFPDSAATALDLTTVSGNELLAAGRATPEPIDLVFGGPPCQGFSIGGRRQADDDRNNAILHFARLVGEINPRFFVMENVDGLLSDRARPFLDAFVSRTRSHGFEIVEPIEILDAANFGVPQHRRRVFVLGYGPGESAPEYPGRLGIRDETGDEYFPTVEDALDGLPKVEAHDYLFESHRYKGRVAAGSHYARLLRGDLREAEDRSLDREVTTGILTGCFRDATFGGRCQAIQW